MSSSDITDTARGAAAAAVDRLSQTGRETFETVKDRALGAASRTASAAKAEALDRAEVAKDTIADEGRRLADSLRHAYQGGDDSVQAKVLGVVADSVADLSDSLRGRSFADLLSEAEGFARRNPGAFVAAAALAGFALARFARASAPQVADSFGDSYGSGATLGAYGAAGGAAGVSTSSLTTHDEGFGSGYDDAADDMGSDLGPDMGMGSGMGSGLGGTSDTFGDGMGGSGTDGQSGGPSGGFGDRDRTGGSGGL